MKEATTLKHAPGTHDQSEHGNENAKKKRGERPEKAPMETDKFKKLMGQAQEMYRKARDKKKLRVSKKWRNLIEMMGAEIKITRTRNSSSSSTSSSASTGSSTSAPTSTTSTPNTAQGKPVEDGTKTHWKR
jgi:hypothetical protein